MLVDTKTCTKCKLIKSELEFSYRNKLKDQRFEQCKACINAYAKEYRTQNKADLQKKQKSWYSNNGKQWKQEYETENKDHINLHARIRYNSDMQFRMKKVLRSRFRKMMKSLKNDSALSLLGVPLVYFMKWIEFQWTSSMTWDNYGREWDIDHVKPCSSFDLTKEHEVRECFHWTNMQPLEKKLNYQKSNKVDEVVTQKHKNKSDEFVSINPVPSICRNIYVA